MKHVQITREAFGNTPMYVRILKNGNTEILTPEHEFNADEEPEHTFEISGETYAWEEWASAKQWKDVWISKNGNGDIRIVDITLDEILADI